MQLFDSQGRSVQLGKQIGAGGEGTVYEVAGAPQLVAKTYSAAPSLEKSSKLRAMIGMASPAITAMAAWPTNTLHPRSSGSIVGILMPRVRDHEEIHNLYSPAHRKLKYPDKDWGFLVHTAMNCATAFEAMHSVGCVIGDVNQGNIFVSNQGTVFLIDCDSFQITENGRVLPCEVGVPHFTPPELQGKSFRGITRSANHDNFGLAVLMFHLLYMGRHPFAGRYFGTGDMPVERAIGEFRFAYGRSAKALQVERPPNTLALAALTPTLEDLFERAFRQGSEGAGRPTAREWRTQLTSLKSQLRLCPSDRGHRYESRLQSCPWCELTRGGAPNFFISVTVAATGAGPFQFTIDAGRFWNAIENIPRPRSSFASAPPLFSGAIVPTPLPPLEPTPGMRKAVGYVAVVSIALAVLFALIVPMIAFLAAANGFAFVVWWVGIYLTSPIWGEARKRHASLKRHRADLAVLQSKWTASATEYEDRFQRRLKELARVRDQALQLRGDYDSEMRALEKDAFNRQQAQYLQTTFISDHKIDKIGDGRKSLLESAGIETAFDVTAPRVSQIPGFGPTLTASLLAWRRSVEAGFRFNSAIGVPPVERQTLNLKFAQRQAQLESALREGERMLNEIYREARERAQILTGSLGEKRSAVRQAEIDAKFADRFKWN